MTSAQASSDRNGRNYNADYWRTGSVGAGNLRWYACPATHFFYDRGYAFRDGMGRGHRSAVRADVRQCGMEESVMHFRRFLGMMVRLGMPLALATIAFGQVRQQPANLWVETTATDEVHGTLTIPMASGPAELPAAISGSLVLAVDRQPGEAVASANCRVAAISKVFEYASLAMPATAGRREPTRLDCFVDSLPHDRHLLRGGTAGGVRQDFGRPCERLTGYFRVAFAGRGMCCGGAVSGLAEFALGRSRCAYQWLE